MKHVPHFHITDSDAVRAAILIGLAVFAGIAFNMLAIARTISFTSF
jgi:hypothetical protein